VIWFLMTSRPDLVPLDLKRQGRAEEHIALFPPATVEERAQVFENLRRRLGIALEPGVRLAELLAESPDALSAADLEAILVRGSRRLERTPSKAPSCAS
jgi:ATP-dependent 26S proteasome regulatory subunit